LENKAIKSLSVGVLLFISLIGLGEERLVLKVVKFRSYKDKSIFNDHGKSRLGEDEPIKITLNDKIFKKKMNFHTFAMLRYIVTVEKLLLFTFLKILKIQNLNKSKLGFYFYFWAVSKLPNYLFSVGFD